MTTRLGDLLASNNVRCTDDSAPVLSVSEEHGIILQSDRFKKRLATTDVSKYWSVAPGDLVFNPFLLWNRAVGTCFIPSGGIVSPAYKVLRPKFSDTSRFLHYLLRSPRFTSAVDAIATGSVTRRRTAPLTAILDIELELPDLPDIQSVDRFLTNVDALIDMNGRLARDADLLWHAVVNRTLNESVETSALTDLAFFVNGKNFTKGATGRGRPVIRTPEVRRGPVEDTIRNEAETSDQHKARRGDILFVWSGSLQVRRWLWDEGLINQHIFKVLPKHAVPEWLVFALIERQMKWFLGLAQDKATTMGHIKREHLQSSVPALDGEEIERLRPIVDPLWEQAHQARVDAARYTELRDGILPAVLRGLATPTEDAA